MGVWRQTADWGILICAICIRSPAEAVEMASLSTQNLTCVTDTRLDMKPLNCRIPTICAYLQERFEGQLLILREGLEGKKKTFY